MSPHAFSIPSPVVPPPARTVVYVGYSTNQGAVVRDCITHALHVFPSSARIPPSVPADEQGGGERAMTTTRSWLLGDDVRVMFDDGPRDGAIVGWWNMGDEPCAIVQPSDGGVRMFVRHDQLAEVPADSAEYIEACIDTLEQTAAAFYPWMQGVRNYSFREGAWDAFDGAEKRWNMGRGSKLEYNRGWTAALDMMHTRGMKPTKEAAK